MYIVIQNADKIPYHVVSEVVYAESYAVEDIEVVTIFEHETVNTFDFEGSQVEAIMVSTISSVANDHIQELEDEAQAQKAAEEERLRLLEENKKYASEVKGDALLVYDPFTECNLSIDEYNIILEGTALAGLGESYYNMERTYGVNGLYAISVAFHESGYGYRRANTNNCYGMKGSSGWMAFDSLDANIMYFGKLMQNSWYYNKSIDDIAKVYCPGTHASWASAIKAMMKTQFDKL